MYFIVCVWQVLSDIYDRIQAEPISMTNNDKQGKRIKKEEAASSSFVGIKLLWLYCAVCILVGGGTSRKCVLT